MQNIFYSIIFMVFSLGFVQDSCGQGIALNQQTAYPDTSICHLGTSVNFIGQVMWTTYMGSGYSIHADFGDGYSQVLNKATPNYTYSNDTFRLTHIYSVGGQKTVKIVLKDSLNISADSITRQYDVGNCSAASGVVFFDCIENCVQDSTEMGMWPRFFKFSRNGQTRQYWLDTSGNYNIPVFLGDTLVPVPGAVDYPTSMTGPCIFSAITSGATQKDIAIRLFYPISFSNLQGNTHFCSGFSHDWYFTITYANSTSWKIRVDFGDGVWSSYFWGNSISSFSMFYGTPGTYLAKYYLYDNNQYGPLMRMQKQVYVDTCTAVQVNRFYDQNGNCQKDPGEGNTDSIPGASNVSVFPGDTVFVDPTIYVNYSTGIEGVNADTSCVNGQYFTSSSSVVNIPYKPKVKILNGYFSDGYCINDITQFYLNTINIGIQDTTYGKLISIYGDGTSDTTNIIFATDTMSFSMAHTYQVPGTMTPSFILKAGNFSDTFYLTQTVQNCFTVPTKAYYDLNNNCVKDTNESYIMNFTAYLSGGSSWAYNETAYCHVYNGIDSVIQVYVQATFQNYYRSINSWYCNWPVFTVSQPEEISLSEAISFYVSNLNYPLSACANSPNLQFNLDFFGSYGFTPHYLKYYYGDGSFAQISLNNLMSANMTIVPPAHVYLPGTYYQGIEIFNSISGNLLYTKQSTNPIFVVDTCSAISGKLFFDSNNNCNADSSEMPIANAAIYVLKNGLPQYIYTDIDGRYHIAAVNGDVVSITFPGSVSGYAVSCTAPTQLVNFQNSTVINMAYQCSTPPSDVSVIASHHAFKSSMPDTISIYVQNKNCNYQPGSLTVQLDNYINFLGASYPGFLQTGQQVSWAIDSLNKIPDIINVFVTINSGTTGMQLCNDIVVQPTTPDSNLANNNFNLCDSVVTTSTNIFKTALTGNSANNIVNGSPIIYTLGFKQSSNTTSNLILLDTLDSHLDLTTFQPLSSTHPYSISFINNNILKVLFSNLTLQPQEEVYFTFLINPLSSVPPNTVISNSFTSITGYNSSSSSNKTVTITDGTNRVNEISEMDLSAELYPNPANDEFHILLMNGATAVSGKLVLFDSKGVTLKTIILSQGLNTVNCSGYVPGVYFVKVVSDSRVIIKKLIIQ